jgi:hypothetical protein
MPARVTLSKNRDWKLLVNREELFFRYFKWRMSVHDLDHSHYCKVLTEEMNRQQKCWFSFLFGMTYRTPQAYAYWWTFKNFETLKLSEVEEWHADNWQRTTYGTDARYNKGHFHKQVASIMEWKGEQSLYAKIRELTSHDDPRVNFENLFESICGIYKYGRMTTWLVCQCLYDTLHLNIDFDNVLIKSPNSDSSMQSIWNGYCILKGHYRKLLGKQYGTGGYTASEEDIAFVSNDIMRYRDRACEHVNTGIDVFKWESIWCQFKRLFNEKESKEYPGHSSGDATSRYVYYRENWPEVDWSLFRKALLQQPGIIRGQTYVREYNQVFGNTGLLLNMHEMFDDMPNAYEELNINPSDNLVRPLFEDQGMKCHLNC